MKLGIFEKMVLALVWKQAQKRLASLPMVPTNDTLALANTLDSRTTTGAAWMMLLDVISAVYHTVFVGDMSVEMFELHLFGLGVGALFCWCRHATARNKVAIDEAIRKLRNIVPEADRIPFPPLKPSGGGAASTVLMLLLATGMATAADLPAGQPEMNTNSVINIVQAASSGLSLIRNLDSAEGAFEVFKAMGSNITFNGVLTYDFQERKGGAGACVQSQIAQWPVGWFNVTLGPALNTAVINGSAKVYFLGSANITPKDGAPLKAVNDFLEHVWILNRLDFTTFSLFLGGWPAKMTGFNGPVGCVGGSVGIKK